MISRQEITQLLAPIECQLADAWLVVRGFAHAPKDVDKEALISFQWRLAESLLRLSRLNVRLKRERSALESRRGSLSKTWFYQRSELLGRYRSAVKSFIEIGRQIGDVFVWPFYAGDRDLLRKHLSAPRLPFPPPTDGSAAEVCLIRSAQVLGSNLLLLHGNTSTLRIGDVTLYDFNRGRVAGLAELKAQAPQDGSVTVSVHAFVPGSNRQKVTHQTVSVAEGLSSGMEVRLKKQMDSMVGLFERKPPSIGLSIEHNSHVDALNKVGERLQANSISVSAPSPGLVIGGARLPKRKSLVARLLDPKIPAVVNKFADALVARTSETLHPQSIWNEPCLSFLGGSPPTGQPPWLHMGVDPAVVETMIFQRTMFATVHNPAFLFERLSQEGFSISKEGGLSLRAATPSRVIQLDSIQGALLALRQGLVSDECVVLLFRKILECAEAGGLDEFDPITLVADLVPYLSQI